MDAKQLNIRQVQESELKIKTMLEDHDQKVEMINKNLVNTQAENAQYQN